MFIGRWECVFFKLLIFLLLMVIIFCKFSLVFSIIMVVISLEIEVIGNMVFGCFFSKDWLVF